MENPTQTFDDISEQYSTWIIKYCSITFKKPLYLIWYTDTDKDRIDKLLTYKNGDIVAFSSLIDLKATIIPLFDNLVLFDNLKPWIDNFENNQAKEYTTNDIILVEREIEKNNLDIPTIEGFVNYINLVTDFIKQDDKNSPLQKYIEKDIINETWDYFYEYIFWPRLNNKEKFNEWERPQLIIDTKELLVQLKNVRQKFDEHINSEKRPSANSAFLKDGR